MENLLRSSLESELKTGLRAELNTKEIGIENKPELKKCMSENSIDIALVQETYLKPNRPKACSIAGYVQLRTDRTYSSALTNHVRTVVEESEREVPASSDRRKFPPDILELIRAKTQLCAARAYPTPEYRSRARALQREVKARVREFRNESWSDLMEEIKPSHKAAIDDAEIAECLADSIETQCSHASLRTTSLISVASRKRFSKTSLEPKDDLAPVSLSEVQTLVKSLNTRKAPGLDGIHKPGNHATSCQLQTDQPPERSGQTIRKILKTRLSDHLLGKGLIIDEQFGFRPAHSCPQQVLRLVEYVSEGFETERSTVAVFFDVAKAFDRQTDISHLGMSALTRQDVLSEQEFLKAPPLSSAVLRVHKRCTATVVVWRPTRVIRGRYRALYGNRNRSTRFTLLPSRGPLTS
ncbi:Probable RNA-directed DNA polymerase from transposon BS [Eumeta japonica]|uniref:Probable RNA-directed DNA polymerase from transposon BS n=1 Tax=Eumeta variegata TaxID=151549 RepID=A0A4C1X8C1_EUMVA|nr:Probable RNA-directed DNA polymerase from transposon BS [Eumeta japonica]